jgi:hypothetical protein
MVPGPLTTLAAALLLLALVVVLGLCALLVGSRRANRRLGEQVSALQDRLTEVEREVSVRERTTTPETPEYVITTAGLPEVPAATTGPPPVDGRQFASVALGESLVRLVSLGHGVRRALSAENRNRIGYEMRREVRRSRRQRKRDLKEARRHLRQAQDAA